MNSLLAAPASGCTLDDLEIVFMGIREAYTVDEDGGQYELKETYLSGSQFAHYYCINCEKDWSKTTVQTQKQAWELAKEHLG